MVRSDYRTNLSPFWPFVVSCVSQQTKSEKYERNAAEQSASITYQFCVHQFWHCISLLVLNLFGYAIISYQPQLKDTLVRTFWQRRFAPSRNFWHPSTCLSPQFKLLKTNDLCINYVWLLPSYQPSALNKKKRALLGRRKKIFQKQK